MIFGYDDVSLPEQKHRASWVINIAHTYKATTDVQPSKKTTCFLRSKQSVITSCDRAAGERLRGTPGRFTVRVSWERYRPASSLVIIWRTSLT
jgi:hypothetical protein